MTNVVTYPTEKEALADLIEEFGDVVNEDDVVFIENEQAYAFSADEVYQCQNCELYFSGPEVDTVYGLCTSCAHAKSST